MTRRLLLAVASSCLVFVAVASAEVSAVLGVDGKLEQLEVRTIPLDARIWSKISDTPDAHILNPQGDLIGDPRPTCGILSMPMDDPSTGNFTTGEPNDPVRPDRSAIVVWPRHDGTDYDLIYSLWHPTRRTWMASVRLVPGDDILDDLSPAVVVGVDRLYVAWRRGPQALLVTGSIYVVNGEPLLHWTPPLPLHAGVLVDGIDFWQFLVEGPEPTERGGRR